MSSLADQACYTLLSNPQEGNFDNEQDIKNWLGTLCNSLCYSHFVKLIIYYCSRVGWVGLIGLSVVSVSYTFFRFILDHKVF